MVLSILLIIPIVLVVVIVLVIVSVKSDKGDEDVIKNVYIYLVLFATLMMTIGGSVGVFMAAADLIAPSPYYQTFEEYKQWQQERYLDEEKKVQQNLTEEELRSNYEAMVAAEKERELVRAKNRLIKSFGWIVIPLPVFLYYQKRLRKKNDL